MKRRDQQSRQVTERLSLYGFLNAHELENAVVVETGAKRADAEAGMWRWALEIGGVPLWIGSHWKVSDILAAPLLTKETVARTTDIIPLDEDGNPLSK